MNRLVLEDPETFLKGFESVAQFRGWCEGQTTPDLNMALKSLEIRELYEQCCVIRDLIQLRKDKNMPHGSIKFLK